MECNSMLKSLNLVCFQVDWSYVVWSIHTLVFGFSLNRFCSLSLCFFRCLLHLVPSLLWGNTFHLYGCTFDKYRWLKLGNGTHSLLHGFILFFMFTMCILPGTLSWPWPTSKYNLAQKPLIKIEISFGYSISAFKALLRKWACSLVINHYPLIVPCILLSTGSLTSDLNLMAFMDLLHEASHEYRSLFP